MDDVARHAASHLEIDLDAVAENYTLLKSRFTGKTCAAVVKADGYGLGADRIAVRLEKAGCRFFFVATLGEAVDLRSSQPSATIAVLNGLLPGTETVFEEFNLLPVINDLAQVKAMKSRCAALGKALPAILHIDSGINRLGLSRDEEDLARTDPDILTGPDWRFVMSHLASGDDHDDPMNRQQLEQFNTSRTLLPAVPASLVNSAGIFHAPEFHFDLARPGIALYGGRPIDAIDNPMKPVVRLLGRVLQLRSVRKGETVGYGGSYGFDKNSTVATLSVGYADGYIRAIGNHGHVAYNGQLFPVAGRVSMDMVTIDLGQSPPPDLRPGGFMEVLGPDVTIDAAGDAGSTISYEILTSLGKRYERRYIEAGQS